MKEAAGEANITVITIVLIGLVAAAGAIFIPRTLNNLSTKSCCQEHGGTWNGKTCKGGQLDGQTMGQIKASGSCESVSK